MNSIKVLKLAPSSELWYQKGLLVSFSHVALVSRTKLNDTRTPSYRRYSILPHPFFREAIKSHVWLGQRGSKPVEGKMKSQNLIV